MSLSTIYFVFYAVSGEIGPVGPSFRHEDVKKIVLGGCELKYLTVQVLPNILMPILYLAEYLREVDGIEIPNRAKSRGDKGDQGEIGLPGVEVSRTCETRRYYWNEFLTLLP